MTSTFARVLVVSFALLAWTAVSRAADPQIPLLRFDPFHRQPSPQLSTSAASVNIEWQPELTAVLLSDEGGFANLGGVILGIGEQTNGYRLVDVREFSAVFERGGQRLTLTMKREEP